MQDNTGLKKKKNFFFLLQNCKGKKKVHKSTTASQKLSSHQQDHFKEQKDPFPHPVRALPSAETLNEKCCLSTQPPSHPRPEAEHSPQAVFESHQLYTAHRSSAAEGQGGDDPSPQAAIQTDENDHPQHHQSAAQFRFSLFLLEGCFERTASQPLKQKNLRLELHFPSKFYRISFKWSL